jgi:hypothetical protein
MSNLLALSNLSILALSMGDIDTAKGCAMDIHKATWGTELQVQGQNMISAIYEKIELKAA